MSVAALVAEIETDKLTQLIIAHRVHKSGLNLPLLTLIA